MSLSPHLDDHDGTNILLRGAPEDQPVPLDVHIAVPVGHDEHRRSVQRPRRLFTTVIRRRTIAAVITAAVVASITTLV